MEEQIRFVRRRSGRTTYTWAYVTLGGQEHSLGDPWPGVTWPKRILADAVTDARRALGQRLLDGCRAAPGTGEDA